MSAVDFDSEAGRWQLNEGAFKALVHALHTDPAEAAREYERLRRRLVRYFALHGVARGADATDEAFNRLAKRLSEGESIQNLEAYLAGIARLVMLEERQRVNRERQMLMRLVPPAGLNEEEDPLLPALERCLDGLPAQTLAVLTRYYVGRGVERIRARERLARELGLSQNSLRNRMLRLRRRLEHAVQVQLGEGAREGAPLGSRVDEEEC